MSDLRREVSARISGRLARYIDEITAARARGVSWRRITELVGPALGLEVGGDPRAAEKRMQQAYQRTKRQVDKGRLRSDPAWASVAPRPIGPGGAKALASPACPQVESNISDDLASQFSIQRLIKK